MADSLVPQGSILEALRRLATPLELFPHVQDRGKPGQERVYLRANQEVALRDYLLLVGIKLLDNSAFPHPNHVLWLGTDTLAAGTWLIVYTGPGAPLVTSLRDSGEPARVIYWHKPTTVFDDQRAVPLLVRFESTNAQIGQAP